MTKHGNSNDASNNNSTDKNKSDTNELIKAHYEKALNQSSSGHSFDKEIEYRVLPTYVFRFVL